MTMGASRSGAGAITVRVVSVLAPMVVVTDEATQSAVIVTVPEAEPLVGRHRERFDRAAGWGVPAHVTVLYPFMSPRDLSEAVVAKLAKAVAAVPTFDATCRDTGWFGTEVLY